MQSVGGGRALLNAAAAGVNVCDGSHKKGEARQAMLYTSKTRTFKVS
jgi:hypothetical protein